MLSNRRPTFLAIPVNGDSVPCGGRRCNALVRHQNRAVAGGWMLLQPLATQKEQPFTGRVGSVADGPGRRRSVLAEMR